MSFDQLKGSISDCVLRPFEHEKTYIKCPHCGKAALVDMSMVLTSYPPQYNYYCEHCDIPGFIFCHEVSENQIGIKEVNLRSIEVPESSGMLCIDCLICGAPVPSHRHGYEVGICEDCKKAILKLRKMLEDKDND